MFKAGRDQERRVNRATFCPPCVDRWHMRLATALGTLASSPKTSPNHGLQVPVRPPPHPAADDQGVGGIGDPDTKQLVTQRRVGVADLGRVSSTVPTIVLRARGGCQRLR